MKILFGDYKEFPHTMSEKEIMDQVDSSFRELEEKIRSGILAEGGEPIPDTVVRIYKAQQDNPFTESGKSPGSTVAVKMYGEFPG